MNQVHFYQSKHDDLALRVNDSDQLVRHDSSDIDARDDQKFKLGTSFGRTKLDCAWIIGCCFNPVDRCRIDCSAESLVIQEEKNNLESRRSALGQTPSVPN